MNRFAIIAIAGLALAATTASAHAVPGYVKRACMGDYFSYCSMHSPGTPGVRKCFRANGSKLSHRCVKALVRAGLAKSRAARRIADR